MGNPFPDSSRKNAKITKPRNYRILYIFPGRAVNTFLNSRFKSNGVTLLPGIFSFDEI